MNCRMAHEAIDSNLHNAALGTEAQIHLAQCADCAGYARLLSLIQSHPRVDAPADFDFRLKARIARARDERQGILEQFAQFWKRGFSPAKAISTLALVAVSIASGTVYFTRTGTDDSKQKLAMTTIQQESTPQVSATQETYQIPPSTPQATVKPVIPKVALRQNDTQQPANLAAAIRPSSVPRLQPVLYTKSDQMAAQEVVVYSHGQSRTIIVPRRGQALGAELAGLQTMKVAKVSTTQTVETF